MEMEESAETRRERLRAMREEAEQNDELSTSQMLLPPPLLSEDASDAAPSAGTPGFNFYTEPMSGFKRKTSLPSHSNDHREPRVPFHHHHHHHQQQGPQWVAHQQQPDGIFPQFVSGLHQPASAPAGFGFVAPGYPVGQQLVPNPGPPFPGLVLMQTPADVPFNRGRGERFNGNSSRGRGNSNRGRGERFYGSPNRDERFYGNSNRDRGRGRYPRGSDQRGRGTGRRGFHHQPATQGHQYFKKWMLDDPWKDLTPKQLPNLD